MFEVCTVVPVVVDGFVHAVVDVAGDAGVGAERLLQGATARSGGGHLSLVLLLMHDSGIVDSLRWRIEVVTTTGTTSIVSSIASAVVGNCAGMKAHKLGPIPHDRATTGIAGSSAIVGSNIRSRIVGASARMKAHRLDNNVLAKRRWRRLSSLVRIVNRGLGCLRRGRR